MDKRKAKPMSARLSTTGYLRLSSDLVPANAKQLDLKFAITLQPMERTLILKVLTNGTRDHAQAQRKAQYANRHSKCPMVTVKAALRFMGIPFPKKSREYPVKLLKDGELSVKF